MIGTRIKQVRNALHLKQVEMAKALTMNPSAISQMESGRTKPSLETLEEIARLYSVDLHWMITGEGQMFNTPRDSIMRSGGWDKFQQLMNDRLEEIVQARLEILDAESLDIPVSGEIAAGEPMENYGETMDVVTVRKSWINGQSGDFVALRVNGRSMEPDIRNKDVVLIRQSSEWRQLNGKICAVRIDGAITLKKLMLDDAREMIVLIPLNEDFQPILVNPNSHSDIALIGSLYFLYRSLK